MLHPAQDMEADGGRGLRCAGSRRALSVEGPIVASELDLEDGAGVPNVPPHVVEVRSINHCRSGF